MLLYTKYFKYIAVIGLLILPFFTKPSWCTQKWTPDQPEYENCGFNKDFLNDPNYNVENDWELVGYPSSYLPKLDP